MIWRARQTQIAFPRPALVMGIVNVTPDSFSDGGQFLDSVAAADRAMAMVAEGAEIVDIGGESTRPGAAEVDEETELRRVLPVIERLAGDLKAVISVDTQKPAVARAALRAGAAIINDIAANRDDPEMWQVAAEFGAGYVCMHMRGTPRTMQQAPAYGDVVREVADFLGARIERIMAAGVHAEQIVLDPGFGFGKTLEHNLRLLAALRDFTKFRRPILAGLSRKSFLGQVAGAGVDQRLPVSVAGACWAITQGANILRVHDVAATCQAVRLFEAIGKQRAQ